MYADMTRCPQNDAEMQDYFYTLIGRAMGGPADDFETVLSMAYPWNGQMLMIPPGVGPGIKQVAGAPFFGLTQQYSGGPKARVFLPTQTPDDLGYYTKCMQYVDDAAHTLSAQRLQPAPQATGLMWAWYLAGPPNTYVPVQGPDSGGGTTPVPPTGGITEAQVQALIDASLAPVNEQIAAINTQLAQPMRAHGPVDLPIVLRSLTSLRALGDIDVEVKPGVATPPASADESSSGGPSDLATVVALKRVLARRKGEPESEA